MNCDMCGAEGILYKTIIEDTKLNVCKSCSKFGKVIGTIKEKEAKKEEKKAKVKEEGPNVEIIQVIVQDFAEKIRKKREEMGLKQKDFAKLIAEKESLVHKLETGVFQPSINMARKLEKKLHLKLIEQHEEVHEKSKKEGAGKFTIGDLIRIRKG